MSPYDVTLAVSILVLGLYALSGLKNISTATDYESFYLGSRRLNKSNVRNTFAGAAISIATVLVFFLTIGINFGWWIMWSPITLALGVAFFNYVIHPKLRENTSLNILLNDRSSRGVASLFGIIEHLYGSRTLAYVVTAISALGIVAILVAEMMVGVTIFKSYFLNPEYIVLIIAITLFFYAGLGGLKSVVQTDRVQVALIVVSLSLIIISFGIIYLSEDEAKASNFLLNWEAKFPMPASLLVNIFIVNIALLPSSLRVWQVVIATDKRTNFRAALSQATGLIVFVTVSALLISKLVLMESGNTPSSIAAIFDFLTSGSPLISYTLYPLFVAALLSALISTADSSVLPLAQAIASRNKQNFSRKLNTSVIAALVIGIVVTYFLVTKFTGMTLVPWILTVFSISTSVAPVVIAPIIWPLRRPREKGSILIAMMLCLAVAVAFGWSVKFAGDLSMQPWNCMIGFLISSFGTLLGFAVFNQKNKHLEG